MVSALSSRASMGSVKALSMLNEAWKNWINWDSAYTEQTDELNRRRHFFYHVDNRGRLFRRELGEPPPKWPGPKASVPPQQSNVVSVEVL